MVLKCKICDTIVGSTHEAMARILLERHLDAEHRGWRLSEYSRDLRSGEEVVRG